MARKIETVFLSGPVGRLEAMLEEPESGAPVEAALVCHPHPLHGGTMHNKVVHRLARGLRRTGCVALRFNYRGVNLSEGSFGDWHGEAADARTALRELRRRYPALPLLVGGFSFGARIALTIAADEPDVKRAIAVGFPTRYAGSEQVGELPIPKYFIQSTNDQFSPPADFAAFYQSVPEPKRLDWVEASDHFFAGNLDGYERLVERIGSSR